MAEFQKKKKWNKILYSKLVLLFLFVMAIVGIVSVIKTIPKMLEASKNRKIAQIQFDNLSIQSNDFRKKIDKLKTDEGIEESIRDKFRVVKDGEGLVVITNQEIKTEDTDKQKNEVPTEQKGFLGTIKSWFKR